MKPTIVSIVLDYSSFVYRVLMHLGVGRDRLEDASQEVFLVVLDGLARFEERSSVRTWIYGICRNVAHAERRLLGRLEIPTEDLPETVVQPAQEGAVWIKRAHERLLAALAELEEEQRQVFILFEIEEWSMEEIAALCGTPLRTCYSRLYSARDRIYRDLRRTGMQPRGSQREAK